MPMLLLHLRLPNDYHFDGSDIILKYQLKKIDNSYYSFRVGYFGDSSCGNGVAISHTDKNNVNLSLVGAFNFQGTFEMIKRAKKKHSRLDTVYIIHSLDVFPRKSNLSKKFTRQYSFKDVFKRRNNIFIQKLKRLEPSKIFKQENFIENDFLNQISKYENPQDYFEIKNNISSINKFYIKKIVNFCQDNDIEYLFMLGPSIIIKENIFYENIIHFFIQNNFNFNSEYYILDHRNIGDTHDHVGKLFKRESTEFYRNIISNFFKKE
jgi:hypothetical protein